MAATPYFIRSASYNPGNMGAGGIGIAAGDAIFQGGYIENHGGTSGGRTYAHKFDKSGNLLWELYQQGRQSYSWFAATHPYNGDNLVMGSDQLCKISSAGSCTKIINWKILVLALFSTTELLALENQASTIGIFYAEPLITLLSSK